MNLMNGKTLNSVNEPLSYKDQLEFIVEAYTILNGNYVSISALMSWFWYYNFCSVVKGSYTLGKVFKVSDTLLSRPSSQPQLVVNEIKTQEGLESSAEYKGL